MSGTAKLGAQRGGWRPCRSSRGFSQARIARAFSPSADAKDQVKAPSMEERFRLASLWASVGQRRAQHLRAASLFGIDYRLVTSSSRGLARRSSGTPVERIGAPCVVLLWLARLLRSSWVDAPGRNRERCRTLCSGGVRLSGSSTSATFPSHLIPQVARSGTIFRTMCKASQAASVASSLKVSGAEASNRLCYRKGTGQGGAVFDNSRPARHGPLWHRG